MDDDRERRARAQAAHRIRGEQGRPEGRAAQHRREAERAGETGTAAAVGAPAAPDDAAIGRRGAPPADPLRNPEPFPPKLDPVYPAITGPEHVPDIPGARASLNPEEIVDDRAMQPGQGAGGAGARREGGAEVPLRPRPGESTLG